MPDTQTVEANREIQRVEARTRDTANIDPADRDLSAGALDSAMEDGAPPADPVLTDRTAPPEPQEPARRPIYRSAADDRRAQIINAFRETRTQQVEEADDNAREIANLSNGGLPPELTEALDTRETVREQPPVRQEPEPPSAPPPSYQQAQPEPDERRHKLVVRGQERWLTDAELIEHAQKSLGHDDYVGEARNLMEENRKLHERLNQTIAQVSGQHQPQPGTHSPQPESVHIAEPPVTDPLAPWKDAARTIQFGSEDEAANALRTVVTQVIPAQSAEEVQRQREQAELSFSLNTLSKFMQDNKDVANDQMAQAVLRDRLFELQREDLARLGIPEDQLPKTPDEIAAQHLRMRTNRQQVREVGQLLSQAKSDFLSWRGGGQQAASGRPPAATPVGSQGAPPAQQQQPQPRVEVSLNREARDARRAAIPQQPERTVAPRPQPQPQAAAAQPKDRSQVVQEMMKRRSQMRGRITG